MFVNCSNLMVDLIREVYCVCKVDVLRELLSLETTAK